MDSHTWRNFRADYSVQELEYRIQFENDVLEAGLPIRGKQFYSALKEYIRLRKEQEPNRPAVVVVSMLSASNPPARRKKQGIAAWRDFVAARKVGPLHHLMDITLELMPGEFPRGRLKRFRRHMRLTAGINTQ